MNLRQLEALLASGEMGDEEFSARIGRVRHELRLLRFAARDALVCAEDRDLRPALTRYVRGTAEAHGRTVVEQVAAFVEEQDLLFGNLCVLAWGMDIGG